MQTIQQSYSPSYSSTRSQSVVARFFSWCKSQEPHRYGWLAVIIAVHGCVLTPITLFAVFLGGNAMVFWAFTIGAMALALITNLAAMPTKITIPVFFISVLVDLIVIAMNVAYFLQA